jgi:hypothetical protein
VADLGEKLRPVVESVLGPDEQPLGCCLATQQSLFKGRMVAIVVAERRLVVQAMTRRFEADGEPLSLPPERIAAVQVDGGGGGWPEVGAAIMDRVSVALKLRTTDGEKLKLMMMRGDGPLGGLGGGETQRQGVRALGEWFEHHADSGS